MTRVDFYILPKLMDMNHFACSIATKAWHKGNLVHIHTKSKQNANLIDELLWVFRDVSFIPHEIYDDVSSVSSPVTIGFDLKHPTNSEVIVNLDDKIPAFISCFKRVVEIVGEEEDNKIIARQRYKQYRNYNFEIHEHKIKHKN